MWYKDAVFYQIAVRSFMDSNGDGFGDLGGITQKLDYLRTLGVDCLWLMPIYLSPLRDDGYDISEYCSIDKIYGDLNDFKQLVESAHAHGIRIIMDFVMNHTSDQHPWFQAARSDRNSPYRDYYVWSDTDRKYEAARIIFVDTEKSNWTRDEKTGQYYWHRFYSHQPDLNFDNPQVQEEMINVARFWLDMGIDGFRADAVPYLFEREGTNCENLPETHAYLKRLRAFLEENYPGRILLCEANQWPEDVRPYFGDGDEFHMGFHFPIMPRIYMALRKGRADDMIEILRRTPEIPESCQWCVFLRNHDELTLEMVTEQERQWMWREYAPEPRMKLNLGIRRRLASLLDHDRQLIELANSILLTLPGSPIIYYGDEIGMGDNLDLPDRNGVRTPMQWDGSPLAGFTTGKPFSAFAASRKLTDGVNVADQLKNEKSLLHSIRRMIQIRREQPALSRGSMKWLDSTDTSLAGYRREYHDQSLLIVHNLAKATRSVAIPIDSDDEYIDLLSGLHFTTGSMHELPPHGFLWLRKM